jgi:uncharacterized damage-inducible protein DinB
MLVEVDGAVVGDVSWHSVWYGPNDASRAANIGISLIPAARGRGLGTRAQRALVEHLFATTVVQRVEASTDVDNVAEQRSLEKAGFHREGVLRSSQGRADGRHDLVVYSVVRSDLDGPSGDGSGPAVRWSASTQYPDVWVDPADDPRDSGTPLLDERSTLVEYLRAYRTTLEMKCADLDVEQLARRSVPPSTMSLLGMVRHLAEVERYWFRRVMAGEDAPPPYSSDADRDGDWDGARADAEVVADAWRTWRAEVAFAEAYVASAPDLDVAGVMKDGRTLQLREVLLHMVEEYARHCGHADLLRERIDGRIGQ